MEDFQYDEGDFVNDPTLVSAMLTAHPDINMIVSYNGFPGVMTTIQQHGDKGKVFAVTNVDNGAGKGIRGGWHRRRRHSAELRRYRRGHD